jgi:hypothetical protein
VLAVVTSLVHSPAGGAHVMLKDHTGTMKAAVHPAVLQQQAELGPGATLALRQVQWVKNDSFHKHVTVGLVQSCGHVRGRCVAHALHTPW